MFTRPKPLNPRDHGDLTLLETTDYGFVRDRMFIPVVLSEIADVAREYPLVFVSDKELPVALTGIDKDVNAYVAENGSWRAHYVPGSIRAYPFALGQKTKDNGEYTIFVDLDAPQLSERLGSPLFDSQGKPMPILQAHMELLKDMKKAEPITKKMVGELRDNELLIDRAIRIERLHGDELQITDIQVIDEKKFNGLSGDAFLELRDAGLLPLIYSHLLSMANLRQGVIAGKYPDLAARPAPRQEQGQGQVAKRSSELNLDAFFSDEGDFNLDFDA